jgi:hypothetical protein
MKFFKNYTDELERVIKNELDELEKIKQQKI